MNPLRKLKSILLLSILSAVLLSSPACKKDEEVKTAPALPPQSGFVMNFSDFSSANDTLKSVVATDTYNNWGYSFMNVAIWNTVLTATLAIPVASYVEAFNHEAIYNPDSDNWTWSYNFTVGFDTYLAELTGKINGAVVNWEMRITKSGAYSQFLWYRGQSSIDQTGGYWILAENPINSTDLLRIEWQKKSDGTENIKYSNIKQGDPESGSYIWYGTALTSFDRFYVIFRKSLNNHTEIEWSSTLKNGHVKDFAHFSDNSFHCWDYNLQDIVCP